MEDFNKIYADNHKMILNYIISKVHNFELAQEMANDVFIKLSTRLDKFDESKASMKTWITTFAKNAVIDFYRKKKEHIVSIDSDINNDEDKTMSLSDRLTDPLQTPIETLVNKELKQKVYDAIYDLKGSNFEIAYHFFIEELNYNEIAKELNLALGTVKGRLYRTRKELQKAI